MRIWRTYICKSVVLLLVLAGFGLHLAQPLSARQNSQAFKRWLQSVVKEEHAEKTSHKLNDLQTYQGGLAPLIHKASQIVHQYNDDFRLPVDQKLFSHSDVYYLLIIKWNQSKSGDSMQAMTPPKQESYKPFSYTARPSVTSGQHAVSHDCYTATPSLYSHLSNHTSPNPTRINAIPLKGGTAIGAP